MNIEDLKRRSLAIYPGMVTFNQTTGKTEQINITLSEIQGWDRQYNCENSRFAFVMDGYFYVTPVCGGYERLIKAAEDAGFTANTNIPVPFHRGTFVYPAEPEDNVCWRELMHAFSGIPHDTIEGMVTGPLKMAYNF